MYLIVTRPGFHIKSSFYIPFIGQVRSWKRMSCLFIISFVATLRTVSYSFCHFENINNAFIFILFDTFFLEQYQQVLAK